MTVSNTADPRVTKYAGLFGKTQENVNIHNLGLQNARIELGDEFDGAYVGLLLGYAYQTANIDKCFAQGCVFISESGKASRVGGLVGCSSYWGSSIKDSCFIGELDIRGAAAVGGIVGGSFDDGAVSLDNCYAAATINVKPENGLSTLGSVHGANNYYDSTLPLNRDYTYVNGIAKTTAEMKTADMASLLNGDEGSAWAQDDDANAGYPYLKTVSPNCLTCTVTFDVNGYGTAMPAQEVFKGSRLIQPRDNDGQKYIDGWYRDQECTEEMKTSAMADLLNGEGAAWAFDENVNDAYPYLAKVVPDFQRYTASFDVKGHGTAPADQNLIEGSYLAEPEKPKAKGLIFDGWYRDEGFTDAWDFDKDELTSNITLICKWAPGQT